MPAFFAELLPIVVLLAVIALVVSRLPKVDVGHSPAYLRRRFLNWFPLGLTYAFLYMGRYNLTVAKKSLGDLLSVQDFGNITAVGSFVYGFAFLLNGPLTDRLGGRKTILLAAGGAAIANVGMGAAVAWHLQPLVTWLMPLYAVNMYFQSFGAVSIVKVNAHWFHLRERGTFGGIFGILISLGIYFAFDWGGLIVEHLPLAWVFFVPAGILTVLFAVDVPLVRDSPAAAGLTDFETGDATWGDGGRASLAEVAGKMLRNPVILTIAAIELCSGFVRKAVMDWYSVYSKAIGVDERELVPHHWGLVQCIAGIIGGMLAGAISDRLFGSRRGPVAVLLYGVLLVGSVAIAFALGTPVVGWIVSVMVLAYIGVHGMLSGTASMDFGGKANAGLAVGLIDGCVYLGIGLQALILGHLLPDGPAGHVASHWLPWPLAMAPVALVGLLLATRLWNARPKPGAAH